LSADISVCFKKVHLVKVSPQGEYVSKGNFFIMQETLQRYLDGIAETLIL